jgi:hypothetical protein
MTVLPWDPSIILIERLLLCRFERDNLFSIGESCSSSSDFGCCLLGESRSFKSLRDLEELRLPRRFELGLLMLSGDCRLLLSCLEKDVRDFGERRLRLLLLVLERLRSLLRRLLVLRLRSLFCRRLVLRLRSLFRCLLVLRLRSRPFILLLLRLLLMLLILLWLRSRFPPNLLQLLLSFSFELDFSSDRCFAFEGFPPDFPLPTESASETSLLLLVLGEISSLTDGRFLSLLFLELLGFEVDEDRLLPTRLILHSPLIFRSP